MDIFPQIPSDNIYKFFSFAGIFLILFSFIYTDLVFQDYDTRSAMYVATSRKTMDSLRYLSQLDSALTDGGKRSAEKKEVLKKLDSLKMISIKIHVTDPAYREQQWIFRRDHASDFGQTVPL